MEIPEIPEISEISETFERLTKEYASTNFLELNVHSVSSFSVLAGAVLLCRQRSAGAAGLEGTKPVRPTSGPYA